MYQTFFQNSTFGHTHDSRKKVYFEEYEKEMTNKEGPGPAHYQPNESVKSVYSKAPKFKFSTSSRFAHIKECGSISPMRIISNYSYIISI